GTALVSIHCPYGRIRRSRRACNLGGRVDPRIWQVDDDVECLGVGATAAVEDRDLNRLSGCRGRSLPGQHSRVAVDGDSRGRSTQKIEAQALASQQVFRVVIVVRGTDLE